MSKLPGITPPRALSRRLVMAGLALPPLRAAPARAEAFPDRPITMIVPYPPGGTVDLVVRALAHAASSRLPQRVIVENRPGAAGTLGVAAVARARPDGYVLTPLLSGAIRLQLLQPVSYDVLRDFTPLCQVAEFAFGCMVRADAPWQGWRDFVAEARRRPGELSYGSIGANSTPHVAVAELAMREGIQLNHVPFRGDADSSQALLGGHIHATAGGSAIGELVDAGRARWLCVFTAERLPRWPTAPTLVELGYGNVVRSPYGIVAPAGLPPERAALLERIFLEAARDPEHLALLRRFVMPADIQPAAYFGGILQDLVDAERRQIERLGLRG